MDKHLHNKDILNQLEGLTIPWEKSREEVFEEISSTINTAPAKTIALKRTAWIRYAAAIAILLLSTGLFIRFFERSLESSNGEHLSHQLPDGSVVELNSESKISYKPFWWKFSRELKFEGEAFFLVQKGKSFKVESSLAETHVLGTSFSIYSRNNNYKVLCHTGRVQVLSFNSSESALLEPNQEASLEPDGQFNLSVIEVLPEPAQWKTKLFKFTGTPLIEVFEEIQRQYDITLIYPDNLNYYYTGSIDASRDLLTTLNLVCKPFKITFREISKSEYQIFESAGKID
jgi:ferric-dicitrate binding protein FerR (iron transport regulator)